MNTIYKIFPLLLIAVFFSCKSEEPFLSDIADGSGRILTSHISIEVNSEEYLATRAADVPVPDDFTVAFCAEATPHEALYSYPYNEMPEVVTLPVGEYVVKAYYGDDNITAAYDAPCYYGESDLITIEDGKIFDLSDPIVCSLYNVKVSVVFDPELVAVMGDDAVVSVTMGEAGTLNFDVNTDKDGYFKYVENSSTLIATFTGTVNDAPIVENKNYNNVKRGYYYRITFKLRKIEPGAEEPGGISGGGSLKVDATVTFHDHSSDGGLNIDPETEEYLEDDRYPSNGENTDPGKDNPPVPDDPGDVNIPQLISDDVDLSTVTDISTWPDGKKLAVKIVSPTKITKFRCTIDSSVLTPEELEGISLKSELDLINDSSLFPTLTQLGFPVGEDITDPPLRDEKGNYVVIFDITNFVEMLNALESGTHNFIFDVENEAGGLNPDQNTLKLKN